MLKRRVKICVLCVLACVLGWCYSYSLVPDNMYFSDGESTAISSLPFRSITHNACT